VKESADVGVDLIGNAGGGGDWEAAYAGP
jgi:hypothetical protein